MAIRKGQKVALTDDELDEKVQRAWMAGEDAFWEAVRKELGDLAKFCDMPDSGFDLVEYMERAVQDFAEDGTVRKEEKAHVV